MYHGRREFRTNRWIHLWVAAATLAMIMGAWLMWSRIGATWVSLHHGGGVGIGFSQHAGMVVVCDGSAAAGRRLERVLTNDPASGVMRHADAGYQIAIDCAKEHGLKLPMLG